MATKRKPSTSLTTSANAPVGQEFKKTNEAIGLRVVEGHLTLLSRKLFNLMIYQAQKTREVGVNAPIDTPAAKKYFWIRLADLARNAAYDSRDTQYLKQVLTSMQDIKLEMESDRQWTSERLVSSITMVNPDGLKKHTGQVWVGYAFPPEVHEQVMAPSTYTRLSIVYQSSLKSGPALALYEMCRRHATSPSKRTGRHDVDYWVAALTGSPLKSETPVAYKYVKRDILRPAIAEVNALTDIVVELVEHKNGRKVEQLQFTIAQTKQAQLDFPAPSIIDTDLLKRIEKLGFSREDASDFAAQYPEDNVSTAISRTEARKAAPGMTPLASAAAYFRWQVQELAKQPAPALANIPSTPRSKSSGPSLLEQFLAARAASALAVYKELDEKERKSTFEVFRAAQRPDSGVQLDKGIESAMVRALFSRWFAQSLWGEPTADALASFIESQQNGSP